MTEPVIPPNVHSPYASAAAILVSAVVVVLLVVFAYSRITRREAPAVTAEAPAKPGTPARPTPPGKGAPVTVHAASQPATASR